MSEKPFKFPHCVFPSSPSSFCRVEIKNRTSGFNCSICFGKETYPDLASDQKNASKRVIFLWRFGFALLIVVMPFGFVLFVTTHLSLQYENSIQTKFEVFVCYLPEVLNVQTDIFFCFLLFILRFFFRMNFVLLWHWHFYWMVVLSQNSG